MPPSLIDIDVDEAFADRVEAPCLQQIAEDVVSAERSGRSFAIEVIVADDEFLRGLNRTYRGLDETTDVLSFSQVEETAAGEEAPVKFVVPPEEPVQLGEVIISYPRAELQAAQAGHNVERELTILLVHGLLHLLGYDHAEPDEEARMFGRQEQLVQEEMKHWATR